MRLATRSEPYYSARMSDDTPPVLLELPRIDAPSAESEPAPRYETANRTQLELTPTDLDAQLPPGHMARLVWRFVEGLNLSTFYAAIKAREGRPGGS